ncbi:MAG TPA: gamma carbonic anhydrase family protein [Stellaceae bacterium]|nr:gamma carbonic anhydrase family protein [Stellaceae bacterium]
MNLVIPFGPAVPSIHPDAFIAPNAAVVGDTVIGADTTIWFGCVLRGDVAPIRVGARVNIQDGTVVHVSSRKGGTTIGDDVSIGHMALIHACILEPGSFVGMAAVVMDGTVVEAGAMVGAGSLVTPGKRIPAGELWTGRPARFARRLDDEDRAMMAKVAAGYVELARRYRGQA